VYTRVHASAGGGGGGGGVDGEKSCLATYLEAHAIGYYTTARPTHPPAYNIIGKPPSGCVLNLHTRGG